MHMKLLKRNGLNVRSDFPLALIVCVLSTRLRPLHNFGGEPSAMRSRGCLAQRPKPQGSSPTMYFAPARNHIRVTQEVCSTSLPRRLKRVIMGCQGERTCWLFQTGAYATLQSGKVPGFRLSQTNPERIKPFNPLDKRNPYDRLAI